MDGSSPYRIAILGAGRMGLAAAYDLLEWDRLGHLVVADLRAPDLATIQQGTSDRLSARVLDASDTRQVTELASDVDLVVDALPGNLTLQVAEAATAGGANVVGSMYLLHPGETEPSRRSRMARRIQALDRCARDAGTIVLPEFGLDPGLDLVAAAALVRSFDDVVSCSSYGAGLPEPAAADNPLRYKFSWTPAGVIQAYARPATLLIEGDSVHVPAERIFSAENTHRIAVKELGETLECYPNGNALPYAEWLGIRDSVQNFARYTCRYEGHSRIWDALARSAFLSNEEIEVAGRSVRPSSFLAALLDGRRAFHFQRGERDVVFLRVEVQGTIGGELRTRICRLVDFGDLASGLSAMQRTVGFTLALGARLVLEGVPGATGIVPPTEVPFERVADGLERHGIRFTLDEG